MLKKKLNIPTVPKQVDSNSCSQAKLYKKNDDCTSKFFSEPLWKQFYNIEVNLNEELANHDYKSTNIPFKYNPLEYSADIHRKYLEKYLGNNVDLMIIGMNPGPNGMMQTGVPFGNINTVQNLMQLSGEVKQPNYTLHPKRPITGLACKVEEPSGARLWNLLNELSGNLDTFSNRCFVHNFCPIAYIGSKGQNITPSELKGEDKAYVLHTCLKYLSEEIKLVQPKIVIAVGNYVRDALKLLSKDDQFCSIKFLLLKHPSPRTVNNTNWPETAKLFFESNDLIKYLKDNL